MAGKFRHLNEKRRFSPEEELGSIRHEDLPEWLNAELLARSIPADDLNLHFENANIRLWRKPDFLEILEQINSYNSQFKLHERGSFLLDRVWQLSVINSRASVASEYEFDAGAMSDERDEAAREWLDGLEQDAPDNLYCFIFYYDLLDKNDKKSACLSELAFIGTAALIVVLLIGAVQWLLGLLGKNL